jgi:hypothetical protein
MTSYSSQIRMEPPALRPTITRRSGLEMPYVAPKAAAVAPSGAELPPAESATAMAAEFGELDLNLDLEVPAFLRRNEG